MKLIPWQIGKGIAMGCLAIGACWITVERPSAAEGAWILLVLWIVFGEWK
jgi:hypothetical protein